MEMVPHTKVLYLVADKSVVETCWQHVPARGIIFAWNKRQQTSMGKDIVLVTLTEMTLGPARLQSSCEAAPAGALNAHC